MLQPPIDDIWRVCPFPHFFWPKGRVAARSLLQISSYPMYIIPESFPLVKQRIFFHEFVQVFIPKAVERHNGIFMAGNICPERQSHDDIQVGLRQTPDCKNGPCMLGVLQDQIGRQNRTGAVRLKQAIVLRMAGLDVRQAFIGDDDFGGLQRPENRLQMQKGGIKKTQ